MQVRCQKSVVMECAEAEGKKRVGTWGLSPLEVFTAVAELSKQVKSGLGLSDGGCPGNAVHVSSCAG